MDDLSNLLRIIVDAAKKAESIHLTTTRDNNVLRECPCCNGNAHFVVEERPDPPSRYRVRFAECMSCGLRTKEYPCDGYYGINATEEQIAELWNRRQ